jgi:replicative DNA helicase
MAVLGSMMIEREALLHGIELLEHPDFYRPAHATVFTALQHLAEADEPTDLITVQEELRKRGKLDDCGGTEYLMALVDAIPTAANIEHYAKIVRDKADRRRMIAAANEITSTAFDEEHDNPTAIVTAKALELTDVRGSRLATMEQIAPEVFKRIEQYHNGRPEAGIPFRLSRLNAWTCGVLPGKFVVVGGRPSEGKTVMLTELAAAAGRRGIPVLFFSHEMSKEELVERMICSRASIDSHLMRKGRMPEEAWPEVAAASGELFGYDISIDDSAVPLSVLLASTRRWALTKAKYPHKLVCVDYLQLVTYDGGKVSNREQEVATVGRSLKQLTRSLGVSMVAAAQLGRGQEKRADRKPLLSDLRESGAIEADADVTILLDNSPTQTLDEHERRTAHIHLAKHRNGPTGEFDAWFMQKFARFDNQADGECQ